MQVFKFLKKLVTRENGADGKTPTDVTKVETRDIPAEVEIEIDSKPVRLNALVASFEHHNPAVPADIEVSADEEVEIAGKPVKVSALVENYRKNGAAPAAAATAAAAAPAAAAAAKVEDQTSFFKLRAARHNAAAAPADHKVEPASKSSGSLEDRVSVGKAKYGSPTK